MKTNIKRATIVTTIIALLAFSTVNLSPANSSELTAEDKTIEFLSSVVGIDLAKYTLTSPLPPPGYNTSQYPQNTYRYPPEFCGVVKEESRSFGFEADESKIDVMSIFYNEQLRNIKIDNEDGEYIYSETPATELLDQAKNILQRYHAYANQVYTTDNSYLEPMQNILNTVNDFSPTNITVGNVNFQVSKNGDKTRIQWIYTENDVIMNYKRVELSFRNNAFLSFWDNWRILSIGGFSVINSEEAYQLALETAQNTEFRIVNEYRNETVTLPDLSKSVYQMYFTMVPYRNETSHNPSKITRDPLTLYPYWQFYFYFKGGTIGGYSGVQVGIWGDTKEIVYCNGFGFYGASAPINEEGVDSTPLLPEDQASEYRQEQQSVLDAPALAAVVVVTVILTVLFSAIMLRHRKQRK
jgi:hypothetical protein